MKLRYLYFSVIISLVFFGCAQIGTLSGGEKDTIPPVYIKGKPEQKSLNFSDDKILLTFDEFFQLNNLSGVFISSPPLNEKPDFNLKRKSLLIKLKEELYDTTTYTFLFGDAIEDNHERNPLKDFRFVFSTGNKLDTMGISGKIQDAYTLKGIEGMFVMLYHTYSDSTPIIEKPYYIARADTAGVFNINYIKPGKYRIFALKDQDANLYFNLPNEQIAYLDSFIIPEVETETTIDSIKAGTVLHLGEDDAVGDTLLNDTVIINHNYIYSPSNLRLFAFKEDKEKQYIINSSREKRGKCMFEFSKPSDSVIIKGINFNLENIEYFSEKEDSSKTRILWLKDENVYNIDSLKFQLEYFNLDSLENKEKQIDTIMLFFDIPKDTLKTYLDFAELKQEHDSFSNYTLELKSPVKSIDTSKIKFFRELDTLVIDTKKQELLKSFRPEPKKLFFELRRPFVKTFKIEALNIDTVSEWYSKKVSGNDTLIECEILEKNIFEKDTLKLVVHYDNQFFFNQVPKFSDTISFPLFTQGLMDIKRPAIDTLILKFKKEVSEDTKIKVFDRDESQWYNIVSQPDKDKMLIKITEKDIFDKDTLLLTVRTKDYDNTLGEKIYYEYSKSAIYKHTQRKITVFKRPKRDKFYLVFSKRLENDIDVKPLNFSDDRSWSKIELSDSKDTVFYSITDNYISKLDTLKLKLTYDIKTRDNTLAKQTDTINLLYKRQRRSDVNRAKKDKEKQMSSTDQEKSKVSIEIPITYKIEKDSISERKYDLKYNWVTGIQYVLKFDSSAFIDVYGDKSIQKEVKFKVREKDFYGSITLNLSNIKRISDKDFYIPKLTSVLDSLGTDSLKAEPNVIDSLKNDTIIYDAVKDKEAIQDSIFNSKLDEGQLIIYLFDKDNKLINTKYTKVDVKYSFESLIPGSYSLKIIYDFNINNKWDTGNYLKNIQPERVLIYYDKIVLESNWENVVDWKIETPK